MKTRSMHICRGWLIAGPLLLAWWSVDAADGKLEVGQPKIYRAQGEYVRYELVLDKALPNGEALRLFIHGDTTGVASGGWGLMAWPDDAATNRPQGIVLEGFRREGGH